MDCARLNFSHGTHEGHARAAQAVRRAAEAAGRPVAILADLCGPKIRVGSIADGPVHLAHNAAFMLTTRDVPGDAHAVSVSYADLPKDVSAGDSIFIDDGLLRLCVDRVDGTDVHCVVQVGGQLSQRKGLNLPGTALSTPALTDKDRADLQFAVNTLHVDYLALSFVRSPQDVLTAQDLAQGTPVIAKIEKPEAVADLDAILDQADGAMVARGDLGVEAGPEKVPRIQKRIIREGNSRGKIVITATQMLDSMIRNPRPTRAEAADVANAVLDGTDALMLSGETAVGQYPVESVRMMDLLAREMEAERINDPAAHMEEPLLQQDWGFSNAAARAAALISYALPIKALVVFTRDGRTAHLLSEYRPRAPVVALTPDVAACGRLALEWGVQPRECPAPSGMDDAVRLAREAVVRLGVCTTGDAFGLLMGWPPTDNTNTVSIHKA